jgi:(S)-2-hydroxyglutarate dehydrogenase
MNYDIIIIGGGIVGLSTAMHIKRTSSNLKVALLEKETSLASHQTGNNSGVIHAGVYYKPGSLKAINCRMGYDQLIEFCNSEGIKYDLCGKLIVATEEDELPRLENLYERSIQNGLNRIKKLPGEAIKEYEPYATGLAALWVPYTGITDYVAISNKYAEIFQNRLGGEIFTNTKVIGIQNNSNHSIVITENGNFSARLIINTAGLFSDKIAKLTHRNLNVRIIPFRGEYVLLKKEKSHLVKNLIYPVPDPNFPFLGVHFTRKIDGGIEAGPNAVWAFKREGYKKTDFELNEFLGALRWKGFRKVMFKYWQMGLGEYYRSFVKYAFVKALQRLVPDIKSEDLSAGGAGVRAQACDRQGGLVDDFLFVEDQYIINVLNAPSPAATASLAIGRSIAEKAVKRFN